MGISPDSRSSTGYRVKLTFQIGLHEKDRALLELIKSFFGAGKIAKLGEESVQFRVYTMEELKVIISHFEKYPLLTNKWVDYKLFKQVFELMEQGEHLTVDGLKKIVSIKAMLNNGLSDQLKAAFPDIVSVLRPQVNYYAPYQKYPTYID